MRDLGTDSALIKWRIARLIYKLGVHFPNNRRQIDSLLHQLAPIKTEPGESLDSRKILFFPNWMITT